MIPYPNATLQFLPEITQRILNICSPLKIIMFGSYARGAGNPDSDLDLLVIVEESESPRADSNRLRRALRGLLIPIDIIVATSQQIERHRQTLGLIYKPAFDEGKVIYERHIAI